MSKPPKEPDPTDDEIRERILARYSSHFGDKPRGSYSNLPYLDSSEPVGRPSACWKEWGIPLMEELIISGSTQDEAAERVHERMKIKISPVSIRIAYNKDQKEKKLNAFYNSVLEGNLQDSIRAYKNLPISMKQMLKIE